MIIDLSATYKGGQLGCQKECEKSEKDCVGISWVQTGNSACVICYNDILTSANYNFGFYRKPIGNIAVLYTPRWFYGEHLKKLIISDNPISNL